MSGQRAASGTKKKRSRSSDPDSVDEPSTRALKRADPNNSAPGTNFVPLSTVACGRVFCLVISGALCFLGGSDSCLVWRVESGLDALENLLRGHFDAPFQFGLMLF
jgi:hypothetical protein